MANLIRSAKSGGDWTKNDLSAYNIRVVLQDAPTFFGVAQLPAPVTTPEEILVVDDANATTSDEGYVLLRTLDIAMSPPPNEESAVDDFAVALLRACGYIRRGRVVRTRKDINFLVCGENRHAKTDVCILDDNEILLLVQEDKRHMDSSNPEAQLIAEAIAAFDSNNYTRERTLGLTPLQSKIIPGITMKGTAPTFYKIPVTTTLVNAVATGTYPQQETVVYAHIPDVPRPARRWSEGMKPLDNRRIILSCYEAFKQFVN